MKKIIMFFTVLALVFAPLGFAGIEDIEGKGYKSGKKSFSPAPSTKNDVSKNQQNNNTTTKATPTKPTSGGMAKGLLLGGLGGLLLGSMLAGMGALGPIFAFLVNMLFYLAIFLIIRKVYLHFKKKREKTAW